MGQTHLDEQLGKQLSLDFTYDRDLVVDEDYLASLPDLQNGADVQGALVKLERVGIHNFRVPIKYKTKG